MENYNTIIDRIVKLPLEDPRNKEYYTIKAKGGKLFLKVRRFVMCFEEFKTIMNFRREDVKDRSEVNPPSGKPCRKPGDVSMVTEKK